MKLLFVVHILVSIKNWDLLCEEKHVILRQNKRLLWLYLSLTCNNIKKPKPVWHILHNTVKCGAQKDNIPTTLSKSRMNEEFYNE